VIKHYQIISQQMGYTVKPDESQVNNLGYRMLNQNQLKRAEALFALNIRNYPASANAHDSMGDPFLANGDKANAIVYFKKILSLDDVQGTKEKLSKLLQP
jgi:TolA-binding protein